jgi:hypothetical protein
MYIQKYYVHTQIFGKKRTFYMSRIKKINLCMNIWLTGYSFVFLPMPHKVFSFIKNLCENIECPDLHAKLIFDSFSHLKFVFYVFSIIGLYSPESQNTSSGESYFAPTADPIRGSAQGRSTQSTNGPAGWAFFFGFSPFYLFSFLFSFLIE